MSDPATISVRRLRRMHALFAAIERADLGASRDCEGGRISPRVFKSILWLVAIREGEPVSRAYLADRLACNPSTLGRAVRWLEGAGLVVRTNRTVRGSVSVTRDDSGEPRRAAVYELDLEALERLGVDLEPCAVFRNNPKGVGLVPGANRGPRVVGASR